MTLEKPTPKEVEAFHKESDVDSSRLAQHHTLGGAGNQAAPGNHSHNPSVGAYIGEVRTFLNDAAIPPGWYQLDGSSIAGMGLTALETLLGGTTLPDVTNRFIMGSGLSSPLTTGGSNTKALTKANLPQHVHGDGSLSTTSAGGHTHGAGSLNFSGRESTGVAGGAARGNGTEVGNPNVFGSTASDGSHSHDVTGSTESGAADGLLGTAFDVRPSWIALPVCVYGGLPA